MGPSGCLDVILGVPVGVEDDYLGSNDEVDAHSSSFGWNKEEIRLLLGEPGYGLVSLRGGLTSCEQLALVSHQFEFRFKELEHDDKLWEDEHLFIFPLELFKQFHEEDSLATCLDKLVSLLLDGLGSNVNLLLDIFRDEEGVIAAFAELDADRIEIGRR